MKLVSEAYDLPAGNDIYILKYVVIFQTLSHEPQVLKQGLLHLNEVLQSLEQLHRFLDPPGGSVLLHELAGVQGLAEPMLSAQAMPLLHSLSSAHAYITMFTHVCRVGQVGRCLYATLFGTMTICFSSCCLMMINHIDSHNMSDFFVKTSFNF